MYHAHFRNALISWLSLAVIAQLPLQVILPEQPFSDLAPPRQHTCILRDFYNQFSSDNSGALGLDDIDDRVCDGCLDLTRPSTPVTANLSAWLASTTVCQYQV